MDLKNNNFDNELIEVCERAKNASNKLSLVSGEMKNNSLKLYAQFLEKNRNKILNANKLDVDRAKKNGRNQAFIDRLLLDNSRINSMIESALNISELEDPTNKILASWERPNGLKIIRMSCPIGVFLIIYESRPNVTLDAAALSIKSGNVAILRGSSESFESNKAIFKCIEASNREAGLPPYSVQLVELKSRLAVDYLLKKNEFIDVVIPRGGKKLIEHISKLTSIPLFKHLEGICHTYIDVSANEIMAEKIVLNAKMRRTGICGATETLLVHKDFNKKSLLQILHVLQHAGCKILGDQKTVKIFNQIEPAKEEDWCTEYLDAIISVRIVESVQDAIEHINKYGSSHTDAIITEDAKIADKFLIEVQSAVVMHNASTQFSDGGEFGLGAEIGISTGKLHARGPVGVEQLVTYKYIVKGSGQTREE